MNNLLFNTIFMITIISKVDLTACFRYTRRVQLLNAGVKHGRRQFCQASSQFMEVATRLWVERFVYGKGLCPWSGGALAGDNMRIRTLYGNLDGMKAIDFCEEMIKEAKIIKDRDNRGTGPSTTLLVVPDFRDFEEFVDLIYVTEELLESEELDKHVQIAHFHPDYKFADSDQGGSGNNNDEDEDKDDVSDFTNRSPFPTLHLIRVPDMTRAIDEYSARHGDTEGIWKRNKETMRSLGVKAIKEMQDKLLLDAEKVCTGRAREADKSSGDSDIDTDGDTDRGTDRVMDSDRGKVKKTSGRYRSLRRTGSKSKEQLDKDSNKNASGKRAS
jgi:uncharacterized protein